MAGGINAECLNANKHTHTYTRTHIASPNKTLKWLNFSLFVSVVATLLQLLQNSHYCFDWMKLCLVSADWVKFPLVGAY